MGGINMNDILSSQAFQEFLQKRVEEIEASEENIKTCQSILALENGLIKIAPPKVKNIYFEIDYLVHKQHEFLKNSLIKLR